MATDAVQPTPAGLLDLESELTCSICTDILYQPLTLLDCLHTFCGSCLKEWFGWQQVRQSHDTSRSHHRSRGSNFTCPSCRSPVRDTRPNATVTTLLEMYIKANPTRAKSQADKEDMSTKYKHGDQVLPSTAQPQSSAGRNRERDRRRDVRDEEEDAEEVEYNRLMEHAMAQSMEQAFSTSTRRPARQDEGQAQVMNGQYDVRQQRRHEEAGDRDGTVQDLHEFDERPGNNNGVTTLRRNATTARSLHLGHQSSLRSLLSSSEIDSHEMEEEIMRQIQEEGLLDGIDLDNIQVEQEDEISERIAQAYRRRRRARSRQTRDRSERAARHTGQTHSRSSGTTSGATSRTVIPSTQAVEHATLPVRPLHLSPPERQAQRRASGEREPHERQSRPSSDEPRPASRSVTDLSDRPHSREAEEARARRSSGQSRRSTEPPQAPPSEQWRRAAVAVSPAGNIGEGVHPANEPRSQDEPVASPTAVELDGTAEQARHPSIAAPEVVEDNSISISCSRCGRLEIARDLHYSCYKCAENENMSSLDLCLRCYITGQGCLNWRGFSKSTITKSRFNEGISRFGDAPHFPRPQRLSSSGEFERGVFCFICQRLANDCYWTCDSCNAGDWGYCNTCVAQARHCTHPLTPFTWDPQLAQSTTIYQVLRKSLACRRDLVLDCDICHNPISSHSGVPTDYVHCPSCNEGDYDICLPCYNSLIVTRRLSKDDGLEGWRRCPAGHRMLLVRVGEFDVPSTRGIIKDVVCGWTFDPSHDTTGTAHLEGGDSQWRWRDGQGGDVKVKSNPLPRTRNLVQGREDRMSQDGPGTRVLALWTRMPDEGITDELTFPKGAEITEVVPINEDWSYGVYCRQKGLFPAQYVREI
ncbi:MAG: hypothetical protein M1828_000996 [Chrysothrix sp. TS-e1954]|nr:MAG: hypothetical protein M1828_000996 [Chrysothrix sp. TS-e1954]